jgi:hypothetical protein
VIITQKSLPAAQSDWAEEELQRCSTNSVLFRLQDCIGSNITMSNNSAASGGANIYIADAATDTQMLPADSAGEAIAAGGGTSTAPVVIQQGTAQCSRQDLNKTGNDLRVAGPPCAIALWTPAASTVLPYVNNGSGLPTIRATVVDCWCSTVQHIPGKHTSVSHCLTTLSYGMYHACCMPCNIVASSSGISSCNPMHSVTQPHTCCYACYAHHSALHCALPSECRRNFYCHLGPSHCSAGAQQHSPAGTSSGC